MGQINLAYGAQKPISTVIRETAQALVGAMIGKDITTPLRIMHFLAQMRHESCGWQYLTELGSNVYFQMYEPGTAKGKRLGNTHPGDGPRYKGKGFAMLTGRANYKAYGGSWAYLIGHLEQAAASAPDPQALAPLSARARSFSSRLRRRLPKQLRVILREAAGMRETMIGGHFGDRPGVVDIVQDLARHF